MTLGFELVIGTFVVGFLSGWAWFGAFRWFRIARGKRCLMCNGDGYYGEGDAERINEMSKGFRP